MNRITYLDANVKILRWQMTYNFDPDQWYENELLVIHKNFKIGQLTEKEYNEAVKELDRKLENMWERLDGSYQVPK